MDLTFAVSFESFGRTNWQPSYCYHEQAHWAAKKKPSMADYDTSLDLHGLRRSFGVKVGPDEDQATAADAVAWHLGWVAPLIIVAEVEHMN